MSVSHVFWKIKLSTLRMRELHASGPFILFDEANNIDYIMELCRVNFSLIDYPKMV
jgi:hypothetical protein